MLMLHSGLKDVQSALEVPPLDKTQMFSESARLDTFHSWPHSDYK